MVDRSVIDALPVFRFLSAEERAAAAQIVELKEYRRGDVLFRPGEARETFFVVLSGDVEITSEFYGRAETVVVYHEQDFISSLSLFAGAVPHTNGAHVTSATAQILLLSAALVSGTQKQHPSLMEHLLAATSFTVEQRLRMANRKLFTFYGISRILRDTRSLDSVTPQLLSIAMAATDATRGFFLLREQAMGHIVVSAQHGYDPSETLRAWEPMFERDALVGEVIRSGKLMVVTEMRRSWAQIPYASASMLLAPLTVGPRIVGVLALAERVGGRWFGENSMLLVRAITQQLVDAAERGRLTEQQEATQYLKRTYIGPYTSKE